MASLKDIAFNVSNISDVSEIVPFVIWAGFAKRGLPYNILGWFFLVSGIIKIATLIASIRWINTMPAYHFLALSEIIAAYCFFSQLTWNKINYRIVAGFVIIYIVNSLFIQSLFTFNSITWTINTILVILFGIMYFLRIYHNDDDISPLETRPDFVITAAWLIYAAGSLFTCLMGTDILSGKPEGFFNNAWIIECISNIIKNVIICYGLWLTRKQCQKQHI